MPDLTRQEQLLLAHKARHQAAAAAEKRKGAVIDAKLRHLYAQQHDARLMQVGKLVEAAGLLDVPDDVLEKLLAGVAERLPRVETPEKGDGE